MLRWSRPASAWAYDPYWLMPMPWLHPDPVITTSFGPATADGSNGPSAAGGGVASDASSPPGNAGPGDAGWVHPATSPSSRTTSESAAAAMGVAVASTRAAAAAASMIRFFTAIPTLSAGNERDLRTPSLPGLLSRRRWGVSPCVRGLRSRNRDRSRAGLPLPIAAR